MLDGKIGNIMEHNILLVDDQRDILRLLHSALDTIKDASLKIFECQSGEEALMESARHKIDLLVTDYKLPGMTGVELMGKIRTRHPDSKVILVSGMSERKVRQEMNNAGALAVFEKPIVLAEFLDVVERGLGLVKTMFAPESTSEEKTPEPRTKLSDLLINFRQFINAEAVLMLNDHGFVHARAGNLRDDSVETALVAVLMSIHNASLKVARYTRQENLNSYHIFSGGGYDLFFMPVNVMYGLLVVGNGINDKERLLANIANITALRNEVEKALKYIGMEDVLAEVKKSQPVSAATAAPTIRLTRPVEVAPAPEMEALLKGATEKKVPANADDFWNQAVEKHGAKPANPDVISLEEARKRGLLPDDKK
jgi:CheY-like chemotaxis protein